MLRLRSLFPFLKGAGGVLRRQGWLLENLTFRKALNMGIAGFHYLLKSERMRAWPVALKVDISPLCNLRCTCCLHAMPVESSSAELKGQRFDKSQRMTVEQFRRIATEVAGKTSAISMYLFGDPLISPDLDEMCSIAWQAGLNTHVGTNFSFKLSDERIRSIVQSGMTHLTVCVDGLKQEDYERTRVGGRIDLVLDNLRRLMKIRRELGRKYPKVEVQYIKFQHNVHDIEAARKILTEFGIDQFTDYWGGLWNYADFSPGHFPSEGPRPNTWRPQCHWPHFMMTINYDGAVIPCCKHRVNLLYTDSDDKRIVGNVIEKTVWYVWNSAEYRRMRRLVSNPQGVSTESELATTFCDGCAAITKLHDTRNDFPSDCFKWDDVYERDARGRVVRKPETEVSALYPNGEFVSVDALKVR